MSAVFFFANLQTVYRKARTTRRKNLRVQDKSIFHTKTI